MRYINADYTLSLTRLPKGPHIGLAALVHSSHDVVASGAAAVFDEYGPIGNSMAVALAQPAVSAAERVVAAYRRRRASAGCAAG